MAFRSLPYQLLCGLLLLTFSVRAQQVQVDTYEIEKLTSPQRLVKQESVASAFENISAEPEASSLKRDSIISFGKNPFLLGALRAYQEHRPFVISPDMIWLLICQGFSRHINSDPERFRSKLVNFSGKKTLKVIVDDIYLGDPNADWEQVFPKFSEQIAAETGPELAAVMTADFSTTTPAARIASQITLMESLKKYFDYRVSMVGCGIPKIIIEGSEEDWKKVLHKTQYLAQFDLQWWMKELEPVLQQFIAAKQGHFHKRFWRNMVKYHSVGIYGIYEGIDGWLLKLYPYFEDSTRSKFQKIESVGVFPPEITRTPFIYEFVPTHTEYSMSFWAGFLGVTQNPKDFALRPEIGWIVNKK